MTTARPTGRLAGEPASAAVIREAGTLAAAQRWSTERGGSARGDLVRVLSFPLANGSEEETATVPVSFAPLTGDLRDLQGVAVELVAADGQPRTALLDRNGHAVFRDVPLGPFRLRIAASDSSETSLAAPHGNRRRRALSDRRPRLAVYRVVAAALALVIVAATGVLFASPVDAVCRGDQDVPGTPHGPPNGPLVGQQVLVGAVWKDEEQARFTKVLQRFEKETGAQVRYDPIGHNIGGVIASRIKAACAPDVVLLPQPGLLADLARAGYIRPVDDVVGALVDQNYAPAWRNFATVDRSLYGVWYKAANKSLIWYDGPLFDRLGLKPPETWDELKTVAATIAQAEPAVAPFAVGGASGWVWTDLFENIYLQTAGPARYDQLARHEIPWTDESVKNALRLLGDVFGQPQWLAGGIDGVLETTFEQSVDDVFGDTPKAAMVYEGSFVADFLPDPAMLGGRARAFSFPVIRQSMPSVVAGGGGSPAEATGGDVAALVSRTPAAEELLRFLAQPKAAEPWASSGGFISPNKNVPLDLYPEAVRPSVGLLAAGASLRYDLSDLQPAEFGSVEGEGMWKVLQDFVNGRDIDAAADRLEEERSGAHHEPIEPVATSSTWRRVAGVSLVVTVSILSLVLVELVRISRRATAERLRSELGVEPPGASREVADVAK